MEGLSMNLRHSKTMYPCIGGEISESEVSEAISLAKKVIKWAKEIIEKEK